MSEQLVQIESPRSKQVSSFKMISTLVSVAAASGILIVLVFQLTLPTIKENKARYLQRAVFDVIPGAKKTRTFKLVEPDKIVPLEGEDQLSFKYYAGYDDAGKLVGVAIDSSGQGFQDKLRILYGYSLEKQAIVGTKVLETKETPGLGDKIEKDPEFLENFVALDASLTSDGGTLAHEIEVVKKGEKNAPWQISAITGATISSKAMGNIIGTSAQRHVPIIQRQKSVLESNTP